jgi:molybdopterin synthase catalytic subunit
MTERDGAPEAADGARALVAIRRGPLDATRLLAAVGDVAAGANVLFLGTARGVTDGAVTTLLSYDAHERLAVAVLAALREEACRRFGLVACAVEHRLGDVAPGEASVVIAASAPHRREAFAAAEWLMERIKAEAPIWKREEWADGRREWVHPDGAATGGERT